MSQILRITRQALPRKRAATRPPMGKGLTLLVCMSALLGS